MSLAVRLSDHEEKFRPELLITALSKALTFFEMSGFIKESQREAGLAGLRFGRLFCAHSDIHDLTFCFAQRDVHF